MFFNADEDNHFSLDNGSNLLFGVILSLSFFIWLKDCQKLNDKRIFHELIDEYSNFQQFSNRIKKNSIINLHLFKNKMVNLINYPKI